MGLHSKVWKGTVNVKPSKVGETGWDDEPLEHPYSLGKKTRHRVYGESGDARVKNFKFYI